MTRDVSDGGCVRIEHWHMIMVGLAWIGRSQFFPLWLPKGDFVDVTMKDTNCLPKDIFVGVAEGRVSLLRGCFMLASLAMLGRR